MLTLTLDEGLNVECLVKPRRYAIIFAAQVLLLKAQELLQMKKYLGPLEGYSLAMQISSILLCSVFGSLFGGIWLDRKLGTAPWLTLFLMILGLILAMIIVARTVRKS